MTKYITILLIVIPITAHALVTDTLTNGCDTGTLGVASPVLVKAVFEPAAITCQPGYYLIANSTTCTVCPSGATCAGGTYTFNETRTQGIVFTTPFNQNEIGGCITNFLGVTDIVVMEAIFEPNNVNLTWNDGSGNTSTTTCTYDGLINIPTEPTRPGYVFKGWKVQTNE